MIVYHGTHKKNLNVNGSKRSRYGFPALFTTTSLALARLYAVYQTDPAHGGYVHELVLAGTPKVIPWYGQPSYSRTFRSLIVQLYKQPATLIHLTEVLDYPDGRLIHSMPSDIIIVFDIRHVQSVRMLEHVPMQ